MSGRSVTVPTVATLLKTSGLPLLEARALLAHELARTREALVAHPELEVAAGEAQRFEQRTARRRAGEPLAYLLGAREFYGRRFAISPAVLVPRPETELLVQLALDRARTLFAPNVLDLGTGSGCIAISLALDVAQAEVFGTDISPGALDVARTNATNLDARVAFIESDWYIGIRGHFDVIASNPPYVAQGDAHLSDLKYEPELALMAGDGLSCLRRIIDGAPAHLSTGGWLLVEHGYDQAQAVRELFERAGFDAIQTARDHANIERVTTGRCAHVQASRASRE